MGWNGPAAPRRKGMARNALTVLGNLPAEHEGRAQARPLLLAGSQDPVWEVREAAAWALGRWQEPDLLLPLLTDPHEAVQATAAQALASFA